jgi:hypothetical protein
MSADHCFLGDRERQFVNPAEARCHEDRQTLLRMAPKILVLDKGVGGRQKGVDLASPPFGVQPLRGLRDQVLDADRVLAGLAARDMGRQIE